MMDTLLDAFAAIDEILWGPWTMLFIASVAIYFTVRSGVFQLIKFPYIVRNTLGRSGKINIQSRIGAGARCGPTTATALTASHTAPSLPVRGVLGNEQLFSRNGLI